MENISWNISYECWPLPDLSEKQDQIAAMVASYKRRQAERRGQEQEIMQEPSKDTSAATN